MNRPKKNARPGEPERAAFASSSTIANKTPAARIFGHTFPSGNRARVEICPHDPYGMHCQWDRLPLLESESAEYIEWRKMIGRERADECGASLIYTLEFCSHTLMLFCALGEEVKEVIVAGAGGVR